MAQYEGAFSARPFRLRLIVNPSSLDAANNRTLVDIGVELVPDGSSSPSWDASTRIWYASINGQAHSGTYTYDFRSNPGGVRRIATFQQWIPHNANGSKVLAADAYTNAGVLGEASCAGSQTLTDYVRLPAAPSGAPVLALTSDGMNIGVTSNAASSPVATNDYDVNWTIDGVAGSTTASIGNDRVGLIPISKRGTIYRVKTRAQSTEGNGPWSAIRTIEVLAGGKLFIDGAWRSFNTFKRWNGTAWIPVTICKRWTGAAWVDTQ